MTRQFAGPRHRGIPGRTMSEPSAPGMLPALLLLALWIIFVFVAEAAFDHEPMGVLLNIACNSLSLGVTVFVARTTNDTLHPVAFFSMVNFFYSSFYPIGAISPTALFPMSPGDLLEGQRVYAFFFKDLVLYSYFFGFVCVMAGRAVFGSRVIGIQAGNNARARSLRQCCVLNNLPGKRNPHFKPLGG
ncbi:hypothetical protein V5F72_05455 [Xanthobacter flavus]|uniref:hypothetical protein n=1 Tax=Xanthobacter flavus TaxID=281 RepID=UPI003727816E